MMIRVRTHCYFDEETRDYVPSGHSPLAKFGQLEDFPVAVQEAVALLNAACVADSTHVVLLGVGERVRHSYWLDEEITP